MRTDRTIARAIKLLILLGALGLFIEGMFEWRILFTPFFNPPSVPGQSKIIEHFLFQHFLLVGIGLLIVMRPMTLIGPFRSRLVRMYLGVLCVLVTLPEIIVSKTDLFRPYPFQLRSKFLENIQMLNFGWFQLNFLQAQHLALSHIGLMGTVVLLCMKPELLSFFAGPRTGEIAMNTPNVR